MTENGLRGIAVYNPDLLSPEELKRYFVARIPLLERIVGSLRRERSDRIPQHRLFLGQRGMGKTTLLRRLALAVEEDPELSTIWLPLVFPEEQYNIAGLADLWLNCLDAVSDALERSGREEEAHRLDERIHDLPRDDAEGVFRVLEEEAQSLDRRLLLLLDNADLVFDRLRKDHWTLREILQSKPSLLVYAASSQVIEATYKYDAAFYDLFRIDELKGLSEEELRDVLIRLAEESGNSAVVDLVHDDPARIRTLHTLTGGNPRTVVLLYGVLAQGPTADVRNDLEGLLDRVTPLYKARLEELPEKSQQLVDALALRWDPVSARGLADDLGWDVNAVSAQLSRLQQQGVVEKTAPYRGKRVLYQVGERFFNIWYLMRASRRVRRRLTWLVRFLRMYFSAEELKFYAKERFAAQASTVRDAEYTLALAECVDESPLRSALETHAMRGLVQNPTTRDRLAELFDLQGDDAPLAGRAQRLLILAEARSSLEVALKKFENAMDVRTLVERLLGDPWITLDDKQYIAKIACKVTLEDWRELEQVLSEGFRYWKGMLGDGTSVLYRAVAEGDIQPEKDWAGAEAAAERLNEKLLVAARWLVGDLPENTTEAEEAIAAIQNAEISTAAAWSQLGHLLRLFVERFGEAKAAFRRALDIDPGYVAAWRSLGHLLWLHFDQYEEAEAAFRRALDIDPDNAHVWESLGSLLQMGPGHYEESETAYRRALELESENSLTWANLGFLLKNNLHRYEEAESAYRRAVEITPSLDRAHRDLAVLLFRQPHRLQEAKEHAQKAVELMPEESSHELTLAAILVRLEDWSGAEPHIRNYIEFGSEEYHAETWKATLILFREAASRGHASEALVLLDETATGHRWRPLREAMAAVVEGTPAYLRQVAPEVRKPALEIYEELIRPLELDEAES